MMGVSMESISKFLRGNRFHVKLRILSPYATTIGQYHFSHSLTKYLKNYFIVTCIPTSNNTICFLQTNMVLEVDCQHLWLNMIYMKTFCKTKRKDLPLVLYSVIYLRPLILLILRYFYGNWNISMGLEVYRTNFLLVVCKTYSNILLLGVIGQLPGG